MARFRVGRQYIVSREATTERRKLLRDHEGSIRSLAFSKDGQTLAFAATDGTVKLWPVDKAADRRPCDPNSEKSGGWPSAPTAVSWPPAARRAASNSGNGGSGEDAAGAARRSGNPGPRLRDGKTTTPWPSARDGRDLAIRTQENQTDAPVYLFQTADGKLVKTLPGTWCGDDRNYYPMVMTFSADGKYLASWASGKTATVWGVASGKRFAEFPWPNWGGRHQPGQRTYCRRPQTSPPGSRCITWRRKNSSGSSCIATRTAFPWVQPGRQDPGGGLPDGAVYLWDTANWEQKYVERGHDRPIHSIQFSPDGRLSCRPATTRRCADGTSSRPGQNDVLQ